MVPYLMQELAAEQKNSSSAPAHQTRTSMEDPMSNFPL